MGIGNVKCVFDTYSPGSHNSQLGYNDMFFVDTDNIYIIHILTCQPIDVIYLELVILYLIVKIGHMEFWGNLRSCTVPHM